MKRFLTVLGVIGAMGELLEFLALPAIFAVIGAWQRLPWQYYAITIGGYFGLWLVGELLLRWIFHILGKQYSSRIARKFGKIAARLSGEKQNSADLPTEEN